MARTTHIEGTPRRPAAERHTLTLDLHRPLEAAIGIVLVAVPALIGLLPGGPETFTTGCGFVAVICGLVLTTLGFAGTRDQDGIAPSLHLGVDIVVAAVLLIGAIAFALAGETASLILLGGAGIAHALLVGVTRYTSR
jgi:hypothetical protein